MEVHLSANVAIDPTLAISDIAEVATNWTTNISRLALDLASYSNVSNLDNNITSTRSPLAHVNTIAEAAYSVLSNTSQTSTGSPIGDDVIRLDHAPTLSESTMIRVYVLSVMGFLSLLGNVLTMCNIYKTRLVRRNSRHSWSAIYSLIFHLSIADVLVTGFCIIGDAAWSYTVEWMADEITCKMVKLFQMFSLYLSTYVLVLIGVDRWIAVKYPMKSLNMSKRCHRLLGGTYILSFVLSLPQFFIFHVARGPFVEDFYQCVTHGTYSADWQEQLYTTFTLIFTFILPLCILFGTYLSTFRTIASSEKMFQGSKLASYSNKPSVQTNRQRLIHKAKMKSLRISVVIIFAFLICWTPYNVMMIIFMFLNPDKRLSDDLTSAIFFFGSANSLVNPLIYGAFHLCPSKNKDGTKGGNNNLNRCLCRGDSQRTSMLTAVTQVDNNGRQIRTYRQPSFHRTHSNESSYKEHVSLLQLTPNTSMVRKSASIRSPHPNHTMHIINHSPHLHSASLLSNGNSSTSHSTILLSYNNNRAAMGVLKANSSISLNANHVKVKNPTTVGSACLEMHSLINADESVSSV